MSIKDLIRRRIYIDSYVLVSIIVVTWNNKAKLKKCLKSIEIYSGCISKEIIVVDNNSIDGTIEMLKEEFSWAQLVENSKNVSAAYATNQGIMRSNGKYIIHLDDDVEIMNREWIEELIEIAEKDELIGIVGCKLVYSNGKIQHAGAFINPTSIGHYGEGEDDRGQFDRIKDVDYVCGAVILMKRAVINKIGVWDEDFCPVYADETEFCLRAKIEGFRIMYTPNPTIIHHQGGVTKTRKGNIHLVRNTWMLRLMYFPVRWLIISFLVVVPKEICLGFIRHDLRKYWDAYMQLIGERNKIIAKRQSVKKT